MNFHVPEFLNGIKKNLVGDAKPYEISNGLYLDFSRGIIELNELLESELRMVLDEVQIKYYLETVKYNLVRQDSNNRAIEKQDQNTAKARRELDMVLLEFRRRGLSEKQSD